MMDSSTRLVSNPFSLPEAIRLHYVTNIAQSQSSSSKRPDLNQISTSSMCPSLYPILTPFWDIKTLSKWPQLLGQWTINSGLFDAQNFLFCPPRRWVVVICNFLLFVIFVSLCLFSYCQQDKKKFEKERKLLIIPLRWSALIIPKLVSRSNSEKEEK